MTHDSFECPDVDALISSSVRLIPIKMFQKLLFDLGIPTINAPSWCFNSLNNHCMLECAGSEFFTHSAV